MTTSHQPTVLVVDGPEWRHPRPERGSARSSPPAGGCCSSATTTSPRSRRRWRLRCFATDADTTVAELTVNRQQHRWEIDAPPSPATATSPERSPPTAPRPPSSPMTAPTLSPPGATLVAAHRCGSVPILLAGTNRWSARQRRACQTLLDDGTSAQSSIAPTAPSHRRAADDPCQRLSRQHRRRAPPRYSTATLTLTATHGDGYVVRMDHDSSDIVLTNSCRRRRRLRLRLDSAQARAPGTCRSLSGLTGNIASLLPSCQGASVELADRHATEIDDRRRTRRATAAPSHSQARNPTPSRGTARHDERLAANSSPTPTTRTPQ